MSTRAQIRFATREKGQSFSEHPNAIHAQFYVHSDGFPDGLGVDLAESLIDNKKIPMEIESLTAKHGDLEYIYYIWQAPDKPTYISVFDLFVFDQKCDKCGTRLEHSEKCIFVGSPLELINKFKDTY